MLRALEILQGTGSGRVIDRISLPHHQRHRRRGRLIADGGTEFLLDLDRPVRLEHGDALRLEDGRLIEVHAAPEALLELRADSPLTLLRIAWHIGNRHTPCEITPEALAIEADPVLAAMIEGLGGTATPVTRPFRPEGGAYEHAGEGGGHSHRHHHDHGHGHNYSHDHGHDHDHQHGPDPHHHHHHNHHAHRPA